MKDRQRQLAGLNESELLSEDTGSSTLLRDVHTKKGASYNKGQKIVKIEFVQKKGIYEVARIHMEGGGSFVVQAQNLYNYSSLGKKRPSIRQLDKMVNDGIATTVTGKRTEPDSYGSDGSPSWLLAIGII